MNRQADKDARNRPADPRPASPVERTRAAPSTPGPKSPRAGLPGGSRPGSIGLAMVIVLVILQLLVVGVVMSGARDQDLATQRLASAQAAYAAESGANLALRELVTGADQDADGGIGTISNDGNSANDPAIGPARVYVASSTSGGSTTLTVRAKGGAARSQVRIVVEPTAGSGGGSPMVICSRKSSTQPRYALWTGAAWGANTAMPAIGKEAKFIRAVTCPERNEVLCAAEDLDRDINVLVYNGSSWGAATEVCNNSSSKDDRAFDIAYESQSGDGLIVYWNENLNVVGYRTWNGTTLSAESHLSLPGATAANYLTLYARPGSDQVVLLAANKEADTRLSAAVWSGLSWGSWTHLEVDLKTDKQECYGLAFESISRDAVVVYSENGASNPRYRTWNGAVWSGEASVPSTGNAPRWVRLAAAPASDTVLFAELDDDRDINVNIWNGTSWGFNLEVETNTEGYQPRQVDVAFEKGTGHALLVYSEDNQTRPRYRTWDGSAWSSEQNGPDIGGRSWFVHLIPGLVSGQILVAIADHTKDLCVLSWNGSSLSSPTQIETNLGSLSNGAEPAMLALPASGAAGSGWAVANWTTEAPQ